MTNTSAKHNLYHEIIAIITMSCCIIKWMQLNCGKSINISFLYLQFKVKQCEPLYIILLLYVIACTNFRYATCNVDVLTLGCYLSTLFPQVSIFFLLLASLLLVSILTLLVWHSFVFLSKYHLWQFVWTWSSIVKDISLDSSF